MTPSKPWATQVVHSFVLRCARRCKSAMPEPLQSSVDYCQLMSLRRLALLKGDEALAFELHQAAEALIAAGLVSDDEMLAVGCGV